MPNSSLPARAIVALDPQHTVRPWSHRSGGQDAAVLHWQSLVDAGLIGGSPPPSAEAIASRDAADALFRRIAADRRHLAREYRA